MAGVPFAGLRRRPGMRRSDLVCHAFQGQFGIGKDLTGLLLEGMQFFIFGAEMTNEEPLDTGLQGDGGGLGGGAMEALAGLDFEVFQVGGLMIEHVDAADGGGNTLVEEGVGGIGIGLGLAGGLGDPLVLDQGAVLGQVAFPPFEAVEKGRGNTVLAGFFGVDAAEGPDLAEEKTPAFDAMVDGKTADFKFGLADKEAFAGKGMEMQGIRQLDIRDFQLQPDDILEGGGSMDMQLLGTPEQAHAGEQADQPEIVVTMEM